MESPKSKTSHIYINKGCVSDNGVQVFAHQIKAEHDLKKTISYTETIQKQHFSYLNKV
jgi:hypothetical protein